MTTEMQPPMKHKSLINLTYEPSPEKILSAMREKLNIHAQELYNGDIPLNVKHAYEVAWRDACLSCMQSIKDVADVAKNEVLDWKVPAMSYLERAYVEIMKENALSPFVNYEEV